VLSKYFKPKQVEELAPQCPSLKWLKRWDSVIGLSQTIKNPSAYLYRAITEQWDPPPQNTCAEETEKYLAQFEGEPDREANLKHIREIIAEMKGLNGLK